MNSVPQKLERRHSKDERRDKTAEVVQMLDRMHAETCEGLDVDVAMVEGVDVAVEERYVEQTMRPVEMEGSPQRNERDEEELAKYHPRASGGREGELRVRHREKTTRCEEVEDHDLPRCPLHDAERRVPCVVQQVGARR